MRRPLTALGRPDWLPAPALEVASSKFERILELCRGKDVLDCGCVGSRLDDPGDISSTSHYRIAQVARRCVGVDILEEEVAKRKAAGFDVRLANVEEMDLGETFDVVVAADLIEHLSNPGRFLEQVRRILRPDGLLCIVTPNALSLNNALKGLAGLAVRVNPEHTCWYDLVTLRQLLDRHGFESVQECWQDYGNHPLTSVALRFRPNLAAHIVNIARMKGPEAPG